MSDSNRGPLIAVVVGCVLAALASPLIYEMAVSHTERQARAEHNAENYAQSAEERIEAVCLILTTPAEIAECAAKETKAAEENRRDEYDLSAQQDMGDWAFWMIWVSVSSVAITSVGVIFVWMAISNDRELGRAQVRAYLDVTDVKISLSPKSISIQPRIHNSGQTPAREVHWKYEIIFGRAGRVLFVGGGVPKTPLNVLPATYNDWMIPAQAVDSTMWEIACSEPKFFSAINIRVQVLGMDIFGDPIDSDVHFGGVVEKKDGVLSFEFRRIAQVRKDASGKIAEPPPGA